MSASNDLNAAAPSDAAPGAAITSADAALTTCSVLVVEIPVSASVAAMSAAHDAAVVAARAPKERLLNGLLLSIDIANT
ncbi:hypothetical protein BP6252_14161 [Coleophoma cylindrospora]|uniref:Uncharacterized protein n=1 Tax=Coleophoma cylindrospora TaxID=1849047 RepID=A0A3D8Q3D2_9HELO|nr:hypothetical protein BP6252_14161 [Coleophoma cylindrospora]